MILNSDNFIIVAAKKYTNVSCVSEEEFMEDLNAHRYIKKLAKRISKGNSKNLRLLTNHIICFTNNFEIDFAKEVLFTKSGDKEVRVVKSVLLYLGLLNKNEYKTSDLDLDTLVLLKDMDSGRN